MTTSRATLRGRRTAAPVAGTGGFALNRRTLLTLGLIGGVGAPLIAACGDGSGNSEVDLESQSGAAMETFNAGDTFRATEPVTFGILWTDWPETPIKDSWEFFDELAATTNVTLTTTNIPLSDHHEKRSLLISAGDAPAIIPLVYTGEERQFAASGSVLPMSDYVDRMPHFQKYAEEWDLWEMLETLRQEDGKFYMLPGFQEVSVPAFTLLVRKDILEEVGVTELPDDWEGYADAFRKVKEAYPDSYPLQDGFEGQSLLNYAARAFGTQAGWGFGSGMVVDEATGEFVYCATTPQYKQMVEFFRGLVADGLFDPESFTTTTEGVERVERKIANGEAFAGSGASGTLQEWAGALNETVGEGNYELVQVPPPAGPAGALVEPRGFWHGFMLTSNVADDPNFLALIQFLDWLYYSEESTWFIRWGVEGEQYERDAQDAVTLMPEYSLKSLNINPSGETDIQVDLGYSPNPLAGGTESLALRQSYGTEQANSYVDDVVATRTPIDRAPAAPLTEEELEQSSLLSTAIKDRVDTATLQFILGERDMSEWDTYVSELEGQGLQSYVDLMNEARQRFADSNA